MAEETACACSSAPKLIFACSGAADVGALSDLAARRMSIEGCGRMSRLAAIGAGLGSFMDTARMASEIIAIDGCPTDCAKRILEKAGLEGVRHFRVTDLGLKKGASPSSAENVEKVVEHARKLIG